jgi:recombinational DNA repair protein (RecF pathway)
MYLTTRALVLREVKYKEASKMLTLPVRHGGEALRLRPGRPPEKLQYAAAAQSFALQRVHTLFGSRGRWTVTEGTVMEQFMGLREDLSRLGPGQIHCGTAGDRLGRGRPQRGALSLGLNSL